MLPGEKIRKLETLAGLFFSNLARLGGFVEVDAGSLPEVARQLLVHKRHMTVAIEDHHRSAVRVEVLTAVSEGSRYWRKVLLRKGDGRVVQFAIVRLNFSYLDAEIRREIEEQGAPLGRILIEHSVQRDVELHALWRIEPSAELQMRLEMRVPATTYGRTAMIYCNGSPAVELLEIPKPT